MFRRARLMRRNEVANAKTNVIAAVRIVPGSGAVSRTCGATAERKMEIE